VGPTVCVVVEMVRALWPWWDPAVAYNAALHACMRTVHLWAGPGAFTPHAQRMQRLLFERSGWHACISIRAACTPVRARPANSGN